MKDAQKPDHISLNNLVKYLKAGKFVIPDFQRDFEWKPWDINDLIKSIFLDYYIGSLLLWKSTAESIRSLACEPIYGFSGHNKPEFIVLDGQQRLTALYYVFQAPQVVLPKRNSRFLYFIRIDKFMNEEYDDAFEYGWTASTYQLHNNEEKQFQTHYFPLSVVGKSDWSLGNWLQANEKYWEDKAEVAGNGLDRQKALHNYDNAVKFSSYIKDLTELYQIAYIELDCDLAIDKVCDIFTQINSKGIRLDAFDLLNALLKPKGIQLKHLWREAEPNLSFVNSDRLNVYALQIMSILTQAYCSPKYLYYLLPGETKRMRNEDGSLRSEVLVETPGDFVALWKKSVNAMVSAINKLKNPQEYGAVSSQYLPYVSILPAFTALQVKAHELPAMRQLDAQRKIRYWYWASVFTNKYSGSVESTTARDYLDTCAWFDDDAAVPSVIAEFKARFRSIEFRNEVKRGSSIYNGIFNLLVINGARDWATGSIPLFGDLDDHHIVPKDWGSKNSIGNRIDSILNRTPLTSNTNRNVIRERLPNEYLPELIAANGEDLVRETLSSHFISTQAFNILLRVPFTIDDFEEFLDERQKTIQEAIEDLLIKQRLQLPTRLRELDAKIEAIELSLRRLVDEKLTSQLEMLPDHILVKIQERLQTAARRNPAMDIDYYQTLVGCLEYADLREIEDTIVSKDLWSLFEDKFGSKGVLANRFGQLSELRNSIRHSRLVTEIVTKDGEAAILWFGNILGLV